MPGTSSSLGKGGIKLSSKRIILKKKDKIKTMREGRAKIENEGQSKAVQRQKATIESRGVEGSKRGRDEGERAEREKAKE